MFVPGILLVAAGYCLRLLLFDPDRLVLKKVRDVKRWAVGVVVFMTVVSALDRKQTVVLVLFKV